MPSAKPSQNASWAREARALGAISAAVTLTMFAQLAMSAVETVIVARLGVRELAERDAGLSAFSLMFLATLGVVTAITPIVAHAHGAGDAEGVRRSGQQGIWVGLAFALPGMAILLAIRQKLASLIGPGAVAEHAGAYLGAAAWGLPAWVTYVAVRSLAIATGRIRVTTVVMLASIPVHAALSWILVFGAIGLRGHGVAGAGAAYSLTAFSALGLLAIMLRFEPDTAFASVFRAPWVFDRARASAIVRLGVPFACRILLRESLLPAAAFVLAPFGATAVAAHAVAEQVVMLGGVCAFGFSDAANMRVSTAIGAASPARARQAGWIAIQLALGVSALVAAAVLIAPATLAGWVLGKGDAIGLRAAVGVLPIAALLLFLEGVQSAAGGALSGLRDAKGPLLIAIIGSWGVGMPLGFALAWAASSPAQGMWWGLAIGAGLTTCLYLARLRRKLASEDS
jgi:MATE family multidrug resistance protein